MGKVHRNSWTPAEDAALIADVKAALERGGSVSDGINAHKRAGANWRWYHDLRDSAEAKAVLDQYTVQRGQRRVRKTKSAATQTTMNLDNPVVEQPTKSTETKANSKSLSKVIAWDAARDIELVNYINGQINTKNISLERAVSNATLKFKVTYDPLKARYLELMQAAGKVLETETQAPIVEDAPTQTVPVTEPTETADPMAMIAQAVELINKAVTLTAQQSKVDDVEFKQLKAENKRLKAKVNELVKDRRELIEDKRKLTGKLDDANAALGTVRRALQGALPEVTQAIGYQSERKQVRLAPNGVVESIETIG